MKKSGNFGQIWLNLTKVIIDLSENFDLFIFNQNTINAIILFPVRLI